MLVNPSARPKIGLTKEYSMRIIAALFAFSLLGACSTIDATIGGGKDLVSAVITDTAGVLSYTLDTTSTVLKDVSSSTTPEEK
jgi:hypothetical protein